MRGFGALTAAEQGLVHEPDVGETLLTRLRDAHLVAGEYVPVVVLDLGAVEEGAERRGQTLRGLTTGPPSVHAARGILGPRFPFTAGFPRAGRENTLTHTHTHSLARVQILTARSCFRFFFWALLGCEGAQRRSLCGPRERPRLPPSPKPRHQPWAARSHSWCVRG